jgi:hypothetical protein
MVSGGSQVGSQLPQSMGKGITASTGAASTMSKAATDCAANTLGTQLPSKAFETLGASTGPGFAIGAVGSIGAATGAVSGALTGVTNAARGVASDQGLAVGLRYAESLVTGAQNVIKSSDFQQLGFPQIQSPAAKAALCALGSLGAAGSGAQTYQLAAKEASMGAGTPVVPAMPNQFTFMLNVDGAPMRVIAQTVVSSTIGQLADSLGRQRG